LLSLMNRLENRSQSSLYFSSAEAVL
jgi:hypothetical protein